MKDNFNDLATEKINSRIKKKSDTNEHLIADFIDEYQDVGLILKKNKKKIMNRSMQKIVAIAISAGVLLSTISYFLLLL